MTRYGKMTLYQLENLDNFMNNKGDYTTIVLQ